jgi:hypothetical protein
MSDSLYDQAFPKEMLQGKKLKSLKLEEWDFDIATSA